MPTSSHRAPTTTPVLLSPQLASGRPVDWWFIFKFNGKTNPTGVSEEPKAGLFGGAPIDYPDGDHLFSLAYACASSESPRLQMGSGCVGTSLDDPLGATFDLIFRNSCNYVVWNDQFYGSPIPNGPESSGHSKGVLAWNESTGAGLVIQVSTPSWPRSASSDFPPSPEGNTLGCVRDDNVMVSQHFFSLRLTAEDVATVVEGLVNASVVTDPSAPQIFKVTGPAAIKKVAGELGKLGSSTTVLSRTLSSGVKFISKPRLLHVPVWQMVSAQLGGVPLRVASWWEHPAIDSTTAATTISCWNPGLGKPGAVQIATSGAWQGKSIGLTGGDGPQFNHAKIGVSTSNDRPLCIFGDMNQQGTLDGKGEQKGCSSSQNGRGGTFYVLENRALFESLTSLLHGGSAPVATTR